MVGKIYLIDKTQRINTGIYFQKKCFSLALMQEKEIKLSIITVCFNALDLLKGTVESVAKQKCTGVEYIVIDGASNDGTVAYLESNPTIDRFISEPDGGLYDAMNKGMEFADGQMIWFVNAGDTIYGTDTLPKLIQVIQPDTDIIYGEVMLVNEERKALGTRSELTTQKLPHNLAWTSMRWGMVVCHQGFLVRKSLAPKYDFSYGLVADIDWVIKCLKASTCIQKTDFILANYLQGGLSKTYFKRSMQSRFKVLAAHFGLVQTAIAHIWIIIRAGLFSIQRIGKERY